MWGKKETGGRVFLTIPSSWLIKQVILSDNTFIIATYVTQFSKERF